MTHAELPLGQLIEEDQQQLRFKQAIQNWVDNEITYAKMMEEYPHVPSDGVPWLMQQIRHSVLKRFFKSSSEPTLTNIE